MGCRQQLPAQLLALSIGGVYNTCLRIVYSLQFTEIRKIHFKIMFHGYQLSRFCFTLLEPTQILLYIFLSYLWSLIYM